MKDNDNIYLKISNFYILNFDRRETTKRSRFSKMAKYNMKMIPRLITTLALFCIDEISMDIVPQEKLPISEFEHFTHTQCHLN